jgi:hypothetical protein
MARRKDEARVIKGAGEPMFKARMRAKQPTMHETEGEFILGQLAGQELHSGERPAMDRNWRP